MDALKYATDAQHGDAKVAKVAAGAAQSTDGAHRVSLYTVKAALVSGV